MSNIIGFHPPSTSMACNGQIEISKRLPSTSSTSSTSSNSTTTTNKRSNAKLVLPTVNETRSMKRTKKKKQAQQQQQKSVEPTRKRLQPSDSNNTNNGSKKIKPSAPHARHLLSHPILHHPKKHANELENIPSTSTTATTATNKSEHRIHHHHHVINNDHCDSCGELYGEMISCDTCPATFHLLCANPPLSREDVPKGSYFCENCRAKTAEDDKQLKTVSQPVRPLPSDPKLHVHLNGFKKHSTRHSTIELIKLPTAPNGQSLVQPSGEIKFRATNNTTKTKNASSNLKRKRNDSSVSPPSTTKSHLVPPVKIPNTQIDALRRLLLSCRPEEFRGPALPFDDPAYNRDASIQKNSSTWQTFCFICRKSSINRGPSIHCDYCPLTYHLDCLNPPMTSLPSSADKWMCPNHIEPLLDRYLFEKNEFSTSERVKIYRQYSHIDGQTILQEFSQMRQTRKHLLSNAKTNHRLERIEISHIPRVIEQFYLNAHRPSGQICEADENEKTEDDGHVQTSTLAGQSSSAYDPSVWDTIQAILSSVSDEHPYEFLSAIHPSLPLEEQAANRPRTQKSTTVLDTIETHLQALNEPSYAHGTRKTQMDGLATLIAAADSCSKDNDASTSLPKAVTPTSSVDSLSLLIDLAQFRLSHAALIHLRSKHVIYIRKHIVWFGSSVSNDICLTKFNQQQTCQYVTDRHACLYYDRKRNLFELLNYSEYGTVVNGLRYGLGNISDDESEHDDDHHGDGGDDHNGRRKSTENDNLQKCFCLSLPSYHSAWDGPAQIEQGTVVHIGCHEFLFYRHVVR